MHLGPCWKRTITSRCKTSARFKQEDGHLAQVEVNEVLRLVSDVAAKVPSHDAVPCWVVLLVKFLQQREGTKLQVTLSVRLSSTHLFSFGGFELKNSTTPYEQM